MRRLIRNRLFVAQFLLAPLIVTPAAEAGMLYKCSTPKGAVTIQSDPCPTGSTEVWKRDSAPAPQPTLQQVVGNPPPARAPKGAVAPAIINPRSAPMPPRPPGATPSMAATPPPPAPPPAAFVPPPSTPSTIPLQWHDEPETPAGQAPNNACDSAKSFANSVNDKVWLGLTQDQEQRLYGWVMDQCEQH